MGDAVVPAQVGWQPEEGRDAVDVRKIGRGDQERGRPRSVSIGPETGDHETAQRMCRVLHGRPERMRRTWRLDGTIRAR